MRTLILAVLSIAATLLAASTAVAQQVTVSTPQNTVTNSFFERQGVGFGFSIPGDAPNGRNSGVFGFGPGGVQPNIGFNQGGFNNAVPAFGGFDPNSTARGGAAVLNDNANLFFGFDFGQGSTTTNVSQTPSVTVTNGAPGSFTSVVQRPFVTSVTPVVNEFTGQPTRNFFIPHNQTRQAPRRPSGPPAVLQMVEQLKAEGGLQRKESFDDKEPGVFQPVVDLHPQDEVAAAGVSSAGQHTESIAEIRARQAAEQQQVDSEALALYERGLAAEAEGKRSLAKTYFRIAAGQAEGELKAKALEKMRAMQSTGSAGRR